MVHTIEKGTTKEYVDINGIRQGLILESSHYNKPLLLFLHGGPGFPVYPIIKAHGLKLDSLFNVCYWDQRGTGMSYHNQSLTVEQLMDDTVQVVKYLKRKYAQDKVFLMGHSWGSYLGSLVAYEHPEHFHAYIGIGQIGAAKESEKEIYNFILSSAIDLNDTKAIKQIKGISFDENYYQNRSYGAMREKYTNKYGGGFKRSGYSQFDILKDVFSCRYYTLKERMNIFRGSFSSYQSLAHCMATTDLVELVPALNIPVFILQGQHDYQTTHTQAKRFYDSIEAPFKKMYTFEHSAHAPFIEEQERFMTIMEENVLTVIVKS